MFWRRGKRRKAPKLDFHEGAYVLRHPEITRHLRRGRHSSIGLLEADLDEVQGGGARSRRSEKPLLGSTCRENELPC